MLEVGLTWRESEYLNSSMRTGEVPRRREPNRWKPTCKHMRKTVAEPGITSCPVSAVIWL